MVKECVVSVFVFGSLIACASRGSAVEGEEDGTQTSTSGTGTSTGTEETADTTDSTSGDGTSSTNDEWDDDGCAFPGCFDMPSVALCDIWLQDCPDGEKCTAFASRGGTWDANKCVPIMGAGEPGDACTATDGNPVSGNDDCAKGSLCWSVDVDTGIGHCIAFCTGSPEDPDCAPQATLCGIANDGVLPLCLWTCDPTAGGTDCPGPDDLCIPDPGGQGFVCVPDYEPGAGSYGSDCENLASCEPGLFCAPAQGVPGCESDACCSEYCDLNEPNTCMGQGGGQICVPWWEMGMAPPGYEDLGGCAIP